MVGNWQINGFSSVDHLEQIDRYTAKSFDDAVIVLKVTQGTNNKWFVLSSGIWVIGFTFDAFEAFDLLSRVSVMTLPEVYHACGRKA